MKFKERLLQGILLKRYKRFFVDINYKNKRVSFVGPVYDSAKLIKIYDNHNIFILPSFTEGHPQVLDEALSRLRPVIVFEEISHVKGKREGVFVSRRDSESLSKTIYHIMDNYHSIQKKIMKNILPTKSDFLRQMFDIIKWVLKFIIINKDIWN